MLNQTKIQEYLDWLTTNGRSPETIRSYRNDLTYAIDACRHATDASSLDVALATYLNDNRAEWAPRTMKRRIAAFRGYGRFRGWRLLENYKAPDPGAPEPHPIPDGIDAVRRMIRSTRNPRHRALCALTGLMGLRVGEAIAVGPGDVNPIERTLKVRGKGDKTRIVPISDEAWPIIDKARQLAMDNQTTLCRITNRGARAAISRHARNAGVSVHVSSHDMRATFATRAYEATHDLRAVQELLGHSDAKTTQVYTGISMAAKRAAVESL